MASFNDSLIFSTDFLTSSFTGSPGSDYQWDIINATDLIYDGGTIVDIPASTANETWSYDFINDNILRLFLVNNAPSPSSFTPLPGVDTQIANVLSVMQANVTNSGQQALLDAYDSVTTQDQYNYLLNNISKEKFLSQPDMVYEFRIIDTHHPLQGEYIIPKNLELSKFYYEGLKQIDNQNFTLSQWVEGAPESQMISFINSRF